MTARTLKAIRSNAPVSDHGLAALSPAQPEWMQAKDGSQRVRVSIFPQTREELRKLSREFGNAVVRDLDWGCVVTWLMHTPSDAELSNPLGSALEAVYLCKTADAARLGLPHHHGKAWPTPALDQLGLDKRADAERVAEETLADWNSAGSPHFNQQRLKRRYQYVVSCPAFAKYVRPQRNQSDSIGQL